MTFPSSTSVLFFLRIVGSLAAGDLGSIELDGLLPTPSPVAGGATTWNDVLASGTADETAREAEIMDPGNNDDLSTECISDTKNAPTRVRRDDSCSPLNIPQWNRVEQQQNNPKTQNSPNNSNNQDKVGRARRPLIPESPSIFQPKLNYRWPEENSECNLEPPYQDCKTPMCDSDDVKDMRSDISNGIVWVTLSKAHPWIKYFDCLWPETEWCCEKIEVKNSKLASLSSKSNQVEANQSDRHFQLPTQNLLHDVDNLATYTAKYCVPLDFDWMKLNPSTGEG